MTSTERGFPGGARFAFTIIDDTDVATRENAEPFYRLLHKLGMRATKTVWPLACPEGSPNFSLSETLEDPDYRDFVQELQRQGFEITWHGATMETSRRERTIQGLERFREIFGHYPSVHANHAHNRENLYWGPDRVDAKLLRWLLARTRPQDPNFYQGHVEGSPYWWGDRATEHIRYARNLTFNHVNTLRHNPSMPYHDPRRPLVRRWFSASDAEDAAAFNRLISERNQDKLERERGACIVATHVGKGFAIDGKVNARTQALLQRLASKNGWFPTVGELLEWLERHKPSGEISQGEWRRMQWRWALDLLRRKWQARRRRR